MCSRNIAAGTVATAKVGRNEVEVTVLEELESGWKVKSNGSGREFVVNDSSLYVPAAPVAPATPAVLEVDDGPNPAPESIRPEKKLSLLEAAARILKQSPTPLNCREMVEQATAAGLWTPTGAKTPEQSLYGAIFREINGKENPRFRKRAEKGKFESV